MNRNSRKAKVKFTFATYASEHGIPHPVTLVVDPGSASIPYERLAFAIRRKDSVFEPSNVEEIHFANET